MRDSLARAVPSNGSNESRNESNDRNESGNENNESNERLLSGRRGRWSRLLLACRCGSVARRPRASRVGRCRTAGASASERAQRGTLRTLRRRRRAGSRAGVLRDRPSEAAGRFRWWQRAGVSVRRQSGGESLDQRDARLEADLPVISARPMRVRGGTLMKSRPSDVVRDDVDGRRPTSALPAPEDDHAGQRALRPREDRRRPGRPERLGPHVVEAVRAHERRKRRRQRLGGRLTAARPNEVCAREVADLHVRLSVSARST